MTTMETFDKHIYRILLTVVAALIGGGMIFYHIVEKFSWLDAYYFCVVTLATVGYGDLTPHTHLGKLVTTFYILAGVGIVTTFVSYTMRRRSFRYNERQEKKATKTED